MPRAEPVLPPNILPATPLADVIKLAQSGVGENVLLTFVTNSIQPFDLDSEEIVYLNDIGVSDGVITTMMQHDQGLKGSGSNLVQAPAPKPEPVTEPAPEPIAAAPSYVNAPPAAPVRKRNRLTFPIITFTIRWRRMAIGSKWKATVAAGNRRSSSSIATGSPTAIVVAGFTPTPAGIGSRIISWGATTFHYGRWFTHPSRGWCWWPDTVWAPSWVSWRYSGDYCGWAPLPPAACYQPAVGFSYYGSSVGISFGFGLGRQLLHLRAVGQVSARRGLTNIACRPITPTKFITTPPSSIIMATATTTP